MPSPANKISNQVHARARGLDLYLKRIEVLGSKGLLPTIDINRAYAGALLEYYAYIERAIERLFLGLLRCRLISSNSTVNPLISVNSDRVAIKIVNGDRSYVDWLPYKRFTLRRANAFFSAGRPFSSLTNADIVPFEDIAIIRNALAHQSSSSRKTFSERFIEGRHIPPAQQKPSSYLRGFHTVSQTRMNYLLARTSATISKLCE